MATTMLSFCSPLLIGAIFEYYVRIMIFFIKYKANKLLMPEIEKLPAVNYDDGSEVCVICLQKIFQGKQLPCKHVFHFHCLRLSRLSPLESGMRTGVSVQCAKRNCAKLQRKQTKKPSSMKKS